MDSTTRSTQKAPRAESCFTRKRQIHPFIRSKMRAPALALPKRRLQVSQAALQCAGAMPHDPERNQIRMDHCCETAIAIKTDRGALLERHTGDQERGHIVVLCHWRIQSCQCQPMPFDRVVGRILQRSPNPGSDDVGEKNYSFISVSSINPSVVK